MKEGNTDLGGIKNILHIVYLFLVVGVGTTGIVLNVLGTRVGIGCFTFYTIQSNALCILAAAFYIQQKFSKHKIPEKIADSIHGAIVMCIMLTFLVFYFLLRKTIPSGNFLGPGNIFLHYVLPLMVAGEYLFFQPKGRFRFTWVGWWTLIPIAYGLFAFIYSAFGGTFGYDKYRVPYFFMDYTVYGLGGVALWLFAIAIGYIGLSLLFVGLDRFFAKFEKKIINH